MVKSAKIIQSEMKMPRRSKRVNGKGGLLQSVRHRGVVIFEPLDVVAVQSDVGRGPQGKVLYEQH